MRRLLTALTLALALLFAATVTAAPAQATDRAACSTNYARYYHGHRVEWQQLCFLSHMAHRHWGWYWRLCYPGVPHRHCTSWQDHPYIWYV